MAVEVVTKVIYTNIKDHPHSEILPWDRHMIVLRGELLIGFEDRDITLQTGEYLLIPRGRIHYLQALTDNVIVMNVWMKKTGGSG